MLSAGGIGLAPSAARRRATASPIPSVLLTGLVSGRAQEGATLGFDGLDMGQVTAQRWQTSVDGITWSDITGAVGETETIDIDGGRHTDMNFIRVVVDSAGGEILSNIARLTYAPPIATGTLADVAFTSGSGLQAYETASAFLGSDLRFAVSPVSGIEIDQNSGIISVDTSAMPAQAGVEITVTATNSGGSISQSFALSITELVFTALSLDGSGEIGTVHTVTATVNRPGVVLQYDWLGPQGSLGAPDQMDFVPTAAQDGLALQCDVTASVDGVSITERTNSISLFYAGPVAGDALPDRTFPQNSGIQTLDASVGFSGAALTFAVNSIAGVSIDPATGIISFNTDTMSVQSGTSVVVTVTNSGGSASSGFDLDITVVATAPARMDAPALSVESATQIIATLATDPDDGGAAITEYDLRYRSGGGWIVRQNVTSPYPITGLSAATEYDVQTRAQNAVGNGPWSTTATATTAVAAPSVSLSPSSDTVPYGTGAGSVLATITTDGGVGTLSLEGANASDFEIVGASLRNVAALTFDGTRSVTVRITNATGTDTATFDLTVEATLPTRTVSLGALVDGQTFGRPGSGADVEATLGGSAGNPDDPLQWQYRVNGGGWQSLSGAVSTTGGQVIELRIRDTDHPAGPFSAISTAVTVSVAATVPAQMAAPALTVDSAVQISVDRAAAPDDGGSAITSYDLRYSTDETNWTVETGISDPEAITGLIAATLYFVQTRAVNIVGAGQWSPSASDTTEAVLTFSIQTVGNEFLVVYPDDTPASTPFGFTVGSGDYAGTYTERVTDNATVTRALIEAGDIPLTRPIIAGTTQQGQTMTVLPAFRIYTGEDPGDATWAWIRVSDGVTVGTGLTYNVQAGDVGSVFRVEETFDGATLSSADTSTVIATTGAPDAFVGSEWSVATGSVGALDVTIASLPSDNGAPITDVEYRLDGGGSWLSSGGTSSFAISGLTSATSYDVQLRAVNSAGLGAPGNTETATSGAAASGATQYLTTGFTPGAGTPESSKTIALDLSGHTSSNKIVVVGAALTNGVGDPGATVTLDGAAAETIVWQNGSSGNPTVGYAVFPARSYPASSNLVITSSGSNMWDVGVSAFAFSAGRSVIELVDLPIATTTTRDLSSNVLAGDDLIGWNFVGNGNLPTVNGFDTTHFSADIRTTEMFTVASALGVSAAAPRAMSFAIEPAANQSAKLIVLR
ncbi:MAG: fibronectin type III domain-containing protein [Pseudomonadota bacterium]